MSDVPTRESLKVQKDLMELAIYLMEHPEVKSEKVKIFSI